MFVLALLLLTLGTVIFPDPDGQCVFIHAKVRRRLGNGLSRLPSQFDCPLLAFREIFFRRGLAHRTHLICCMMSLSPCGRERIATARCCAQRGECVEGGSSKIPCHTWRR